MENQLTQVHLKSGRETSVDMDVISAEVSMWTELMLLWFPNFH